MDKNIDIYEIRKQLDEVDNSLLELLNTRFDLIYKMKTAKAKQNLIKTEDLSREEEIIKRLISKNTKKTIKDADIVEIWTLLFTLSKKVQGKI